MKPRAVHAPALVARAWVASALLGGLVVALGPASGAVPVGLTPASLPDYLARAVGPGARAVRVNGVYGSGRDGAWQFVAHLTWRTSQGDVAGGVVRLPQDAGGQAGDSPVSRDQLIDEEARGWTLDRLRRETKAVGPVGARAALLELEIPAEDSGTITFCSADGQIALTCRSRGPSGAASSFNARLQLSPDDGPLSVRRG